MRRRKGLFVVRWTEKTLQPRDVRAQCSGIAPLFEEDHLARAVRAPIVGVRDAAVILGQRAGREVLRKTGELISLPARIVMVKRIVIIAALAG